MTPPNEDMMKALEKLGFKPKVTPFNDGWKVTHPLRFRRPKALGARFNLASPEAVFQGLYLRPRFDLALLMLGERVLVGGMA